MQSLILRSHFGKTSIKIDPEVVINYELPVENLKSNPKKFNKDLRPMFSVEISGPLGSTSFRLFPFIRLTKTAEELYVDIENKENKIEKAMWGTSRALLNNAVIGCTQGHKCIVTLKGIGYRAILEKDENGIEKIGIKAGFSHIKYFKIPYGVKANVMQTAIVLSGVDKQQVKLFAATIRACRPPESYKGKGIYIDNELVKLKERKK
eukprot:NODE_90_length_21806_cov_0.389137.p6 type:complete len:207 gc:universal NODE_90_length_21806_cov_0.389137:10664-11284(+)